MAANWPGEPWPLQVYVPLPGGDSVRGIPNKAHDLVHTGSMRNLHCLLTPISLEIYLTQGRSSGNSGEH